MVLAVLALNLAVMLSTPVDGSHHLAHALGGVLVALLSRKLVAVAAYSEGRDAKSRSRSG